MSYNGSHVIYNWPSINYTIIDQDIDAYKEINATSYLHRRGTSCLNRIKRFKKTGCSSCGTFKGYYSGHNCKNAGNKGYSCLESCTSLGGLDESYKCKESCGGVAGFGGYENGLCWTKKCKNQIVQDEF